MARVPFRLLGRVFLLRGFHINLRVALVALFGGAAIVMAFALTNYISRAFLDDLKWLDERRANLLLKDAAHHVWHVLRQAERVDQDFKAMAGVYRMTLQHKQALHTGEEKATQERAVYKEQILPLLFLSLGQSSLVKSLTWVGSNRMMTVMRLSNEDALFWSTFARYGNKPSLKKLKARARFVVQGWMANAEGGAADRAGRWLLCDKSGAELWSGKLPAALLKKALREHASWEAQEVGRKVRSAAPSIALQPASLLVGPHSLLFGGVGLTLNVPRKKGGGKEARLALHLDLSVLAEALQKGMQRDVRLLLLLDKKGACLAHPDVDQGFLLKGERLISQTFAQLFPAWSKQHFVPSVDRLFLKMKKDETLFLKAPIISLLGLPPSYMRKALKDVFLVAQVSDARIMHMLTHTTREAVGFALLLTLLVCGVIFWVASRVAQPVAQTAHALDNLRRLQLDEPVMLHSTFNEVNRLLQALASVLKALRSFQKFVPRKVVAQLLETGQEAKLGGEARTLTLLFSDIAGFTSIAEKMSPDALTHHLSDYFAGMEEEIRKTSGTVDKFIGDAVMAFWGAPTHDALHAVHACRAALMCQRKLEELNALWDRQGKMTMQARIGMGTGPVVIGNVGSHSRFQYTAMGDTVNLASRLEGLNKVYKTGILANEALVKAAEALFLFRVVDKVAVKGKESGGLVYELLCERSVLRGVTHHPLGQLSEMCAEAFAFYERGDFRKALGLYRLIARMYSDEAARLMMQRCQSFLVNKPDSWDGVWHASQK